MDRKWSDEDFEIIKSIGKGSFAEVFLAIEKSSNI